MDYQQTNPTASSPLPTALTSEEEVVELDWPEQLQALADPTRFAIFSAASWGRCTTVKEIAERIGRDPGALYRHFEKLVEAGLLEVAGTVPTSRRAARVYRAPREPRFIYRADEPEMIEALNAMVRSAARHASRGVESSTTSGKAVTRGAHRDTLMSVQSGWLDDDDLEELNRMTDELRRFLLSREKREGSRHIEVSVFMSPCGETDRREPENGDTTCDDSC